MPAHQAVLPTQGMFFPQVMLFPSLSQSVNHPLAFRRKAQVQILRARKSLNGSQQLRNEVNIIIAHETLSINDSSHM